MAGILPESLGLFDTLTIDEHLLLSGPIYGLTHSETRHRADQLLHALIARRGRDTFLNQCSQGCVRRPRWLWRCCTILACCS